MGPRPLPTVLYLHGGAWSQGTKEEAVTALLPFFSTGWAVVSPEYRLAPTDLAPAAVEDAVCVLRWVATQAGEYGFDLRRLVVAGYSAGGHLALMLGLLPDSASFGQHCPIRSPRPAAVLNLAGITDVTELLARPIERKWAVKWIGDPLTRADVARMVSPLTWVRPGVSPVITVHSAADAVVPYDQARRLHAALSRARVPNRVCNASRGGHDLLGTPEAEAVMTGLMAIMSGGAPDSAAVQAVCEASDAARAVSALPAE
jgi:acetyl esterase/lipase